MRSAVGLRKVSADLSAGILNELNSVKNTNKERLTLNFTSMEFKGLLVEKL